MLFNSVVALAIFACSVSAQSNTTAVDPSTIDPQLKASWCNGQQNVCTTLCSKSVKTNTCDATTLSYSCLCASNSSAPDLADYKTSMPYFLCEKSYDLCIQAHPNDQLGQNNCQTSIRDHCGTLDIANFTAPATTSTASSAPSGSATTTATDSGSASGTASATGSAASASATKSSAALAAVVGKDFGSGFIIAGLFAVFGLML